jgi:hypothetical protein
MSPPPCANSYSLWQYLAHYLPDSVEICLILTIHIYREIDTMQNIPDTKPIQFKKYNVKHSKYNMVGRLPIRQIVLSQSGSWKGIYIQTEILDIYKTVFARIYTFPPRIGLDYQTWKPMTQTRWRTTLHTMCLHALFRNRNATFVPTALAMNKLSQCSE